MGYSSDGVAYTLIIGTTQYIRRSTPYGGACDEGNLLWVGPNVPDSDSAWDGPC